MWLTSNSPARVRTAMCSSTMPEYSTGMSQPPNGTILRAKDAMAGVERRLLERRGRGMCHQTRQDSQPLQRALAGPYPMEVYYAAQSGVKEDSRNPDQAAYGGPPFATESA